MFLVFSIGFTFNVDLYLYPEENASNLLETDFQLTGEEYTLISINDSIIFLLKDGDPVVEEEEIESIIYQHYKEIGYPSEDEDSYLIQ